MSSSYMIDPYARNEERKAQREAIAKLNREAAENWDNPTWRATAAQIASETIYEGFEHENLIDLFCEVERAPFDGRVVMREVRGLRAHWVARGGYIEASTLNADTFELPRDTIGFHVTEFEDKLRTNFAETQATMIDLGIKRLDAQVNARALALLQAAIPSSSPYYIDGAGVSLTEVNTALREVRDESKTFEVSIVGRATMTDQIMDELLGGSNNGSGFIPETNEDLVRRGVLGTYRGARIITLKNFKDDQDESFFPANEMFVLSNDAMKFAFWGGMISKEYTEMDNWYWGYLARLDAGGLVHRPERARRVVDTSITP